MKNVMTGQMSPKRMTGWTFASQNKNDVGLSYSSRLSIEDQMQIKILFPDNLIAHKEFLIISEVFRCISFFFFKWYYFDICRAIEGIRPPLYIFVEAFVLSWYFYRSGGQMYGMGLMYYTRKYIIYLLHC